MIHSYKDLSESRLVNAYASQIINAIRDDESMPGLYDDIYSMLLEVGPGRMITIGNPAITASASWWGAFFGLSLSADDLDELKEIDL
ncbi:hypothetical protein QMS71_08710 [Cronobacter sakazakii]|uniref:Uncharacterized protein n=1 Tax=Pluralibacter gergoviae TaxID=61647 RepID=A0AAW8HK81_PLUGE|nr:MULTISPECIES: hypothetical protein [Enterobacteriaceae]ELY2809112.1 hypothetical protein [Cronobacter sakazakii]MBT1832145.1 hypothetical protein [Enterobacter hormaechei subsp. xiangfangensis]PWF49669.1 hypothetical protein BHT19_0001235 [[Kluyvera] intestini]HDR2485540.1 hypothetical protein [Enterobacter ludwigii]EKM3053710.1 hypothetical protein [Escherichia coli]